MPRALRIMQDLKGAGFSDSQSLAIAKTISKARATPDSVCNKDDIADELSAAGFSEAISDRMTDVLGHCFWSERFGTSYREISEKTQLVQAGLINARAAAFLAAIDDCIISSRGNEIHAPVRLTLTPGQVVMCDFTYLRKPEMQKARRAIVVSARAVNGNGRCAVVPVSMQEANPPNLHHHRFGPGSYGFFHRDNPVWAVCDHIYTVALARLWQINIRNRPAIPSVSAQDLAAIKTIVRTTLAL